MDTQKIFHKAVVGGTFDHFHLGHEKLLATAIAGSEHLTIGIAKEELFQHKTLAESIEPDEARGLSVWNCIVKHHAEAKAEIIKIATLYGNTLEEADIQTIFVTEENLPNVAKINAKREEQGFSPLETVLVPYVMASDGKPITSERIRIGEINREGVVYQDLFPSLLTLPERLRSELHEPIGELFPGLSVVKQRLENARVISVGDIVTDELSKEGITPMISIIDFKTRRHELDSAPIAKTFDAINHQGTIDPQAVTAFIAAKKNYLDTKQPQTLIVNGEEDLLALPAILLAPLGTIVLYGQVDQGVVVNEVTEELKAKVVDLIKQFTSRQNTP